MIQFKKIDKDERFFRNMNKEKTLADFKLKNF